MHPRFDQDARQERALTARGNDIQLLAAGVAVEFVDLLDPGGLGLLLQRWPMRAQTRWYSPSLTACWNSMRWTPAFLPRLPARVSLMSWLNGLPMPLWVLMTRTDPPQISSASAAFEQLVQLIVERGLVDDHDALLAAQVGRTAGQGDDAEAGREFDGEGLDVTVAVGLVVPDAFLDFTGGVVEGRAHIAHAWMYSMVMSRL